MNINCDYDDSEKFSIIMNIFTPNITLCQTSFHFLVYFLSALVNQANNKKNMIVKTNIYIFIESMV